MASNLIHFSLLLVCFLFIFFHLSSADDALIETVCRDAHDKSFCLQQFRSNPSSAKADLYGLCQISVQFIYAQAITTRDKIPGLLQHATDPTMKYRLQFCLNNYKDAIPKFNDAFTAAVNKAYRDVLTKIGQGFYNATSCQDVFQRTKPVQESPLTADTVRIVQLVQLPALVIKQIH